MGVAKAIIFSILISFILLQFVQANKMVNGEGYHGVAQSDCGVACEARCSLASRQKMCLRACGTCCARCKCVPPGTYGNEDVCPCYATMTTHDGRHKCP
ncbi:Snakin-2 [Bienertia sinuspersici]